MPKETPADLATSFSVERLVCTAFSITLYRIVHKPLDSAPPVGVEESERARSMYTFLFVDDEQLVRRGFKNKIDWKSHGFNLLEPCENGTDAVSVIRSVHPDVVMTDICMPHMDGLTVAEYTAAHFPDIVTVILSGFDDFQYAQKAIRTKAFDYVLKPVTPQDLKSLLVKIKAKLDADRRLRENENALKLKAQEGDTLLKMKNVVNFLSGARITLHEEDFRSFFGFSPRDLACAAIVAEEDRGESLNDGARAPRGLSAGGLSDALAAATSARWALPFSTGQNREAVLVFETDTRSCDRVAAQMASRMAETREATVGVGRAYESWLDASRTFQEAVAALSYRLISTPGKAFRYAQAREDDSASLAELKVGRDKLCRATVSGQAIEDTLEDFFATMRAMELSPQRVRHEIGSLFASILDAFGALGVSSLTVSADLCIDYYSTVERLKTMEEIRCLLNRLSSYSAKVVDLRNLHVPEWKVLDIKDYVTRHYQHGLSVQKVAEALSISSSYLSKLVKRYLHASFVDYLTYYRLERAKDLLGTTGLMTYEIAEKVGYPDARYFSSIFKKRLGVTPSEYRNECRRDKSGM
jgi:two-component system response regulator YesN